MNIPDMTVVICSDCERFGRRCTPAHFTIDALGRVIKHIDDPPCSNVQWWPGIEQPQPGDVDGTVEIREIEP